MTCATSRRKVRVDFGSADVARPTASPPARRTGRIERQRLLAHDLGAAGAHRRHVDARSRERSRRGARAGCGTDVKILTAARPPGVCKCDRYWPSRTGQARYYGALCVEWQRLRLLVVLSLCPDFSSLIRSLLCSSTYDEASANARTTSLAHRIDAAQRHCDEAVPHGARRSKSPSAPQRRC